MTDYTIAPLEEPTWQLDPSDFSARLVQRWPNAQVYVGAPAGSTMALEAIIPSSTRDVTLTLSGTGQAVSIEAATPEDTAVVTLWIRDQITAEGPPLHLIEDASMRMIELRGDLTSRDLEEQLRR